MKKQARASYDVVPIEEIRDGVVILSNGSLRAVLMASSLNFALKSSEEQDAIILQYQNFLNSLDFSLQICVESRKLNIEPYLDTLRDRVKVETNELLRIQISEYITFVKEFVETANIVAKTFYIVVPFTPVSINLQKTGITGIFDSLFGKRKEGEALIKPAEFEEYKTQLWQRVDTVIQGLVRTGVRAVPLNTEELIELYFTLFNPEEAGKSKAPQFGQEA